MDKKMIQIRNVPSQLHRRLKAQAALEGLSLSEYLLAELNRLGEQPTIQEWLERVRTREPVDIGMSSEEAIRRERDSR